MVPIFAAIPGALPAALLVIMCVILWDLWKHGQ